LPDRRAACWIALVILQKRVVGLTQLALDRFVTRARRAAGVRAEVNVLVTSNDELQELNRRFRGKDQPTDVLSFPALPGLKPQYAGDIAISAEIAAHNARALGHTVAEEIKILVLHGMLHLRGYDHERDDGRMARREKKLRGDLRLPIGLIERAAQPGQGPRRRK
jgi:probable rRNA maturation factor